MQLYKINATPVRTEYTDSVNNGRVELYPDKVSQVCQEYGIDGFTIYPVTGFWQGVKEVSFVIDIASDTSDTVDKIAKRLRRIYNQDAVMVTYPDNSVKFIER